ncbi:PLC-like phosphodiesterase [Aspergillus pseudoustus]|uniref:Altered inheritance of mitochondria protein 6 n=1 Tax=Aspergillus pseudoustus TaxID=1810923 RepID=A0ABR4JE21_9EURO
MSSSSACHPSQSSQLSSFPEAAARPQMPSNTYQDGDGSKVERAANKSGTSSEVHEEPVYDSDPEEARPISRHRQRGSSIWSRGLAAVSPLFASSDKSHQKFDASTFPLLPFHNSHTRLPRRWLRKTTRSCCIFYCVIGFLAMLGVIQFFILACSFIVSFFPDEIDRATAHWRQSQELSPSDITHWPTDISRDIIPVQCHSHNDYWRRVPLYSALEAGCVGVEADVWLFDEELYVGHSKSSLTPSRTLRSMYIDPLMRILRRQNPITHFHPDLDNPSNGVFDTDPSQPLIFLIDFKTDGEETWDYVVAQLAPLRESGYLTYYNGTDIIKGPIAVVGTGNTPFNRVAENSTYRDIFFDAPLDRLVDNVDRIDNPARIEARAGNSGQGLSGISNGDIEPNTFDTTNSYYASVSFKKAVGIPWMLHLTDRQVQTIRSQVRAAHRQGLKVRYWGTPDWPRSLRNHVWRVLAQEGVDMLNVDDLESATRKDWAPRLSDWWH